MLEYITHPATRSQLGAIVNNPSHAYVFSGPKYVYKRRAAEEVALSLAEAKSIDDPNIIVVSADEDGGRLKISHIKAALEQLVRTAYREAAHRVVLVVDAEAMTPDASNALLKNLEEPRDGVVFILVTNAANALLPTIRSRTQQVNFYTSSLSQGGLPPRLSEELKNSPELAERHASARTMADDFIKGDISSRFLIAKQTHETGLSADLLGYIADALRAEGITSATEASLEAVIRAEDNLARNVSDRLCIEYLGMEMAL